MSLPDPLMLGGVTAAPRIYSPQPNQSKYRKEYEGGNYIEVTATQQVTKARKRHLIRFDSYSPPAADTGLQASASFTLTVDEPLASAYFTDSFVNDSWELFRDTVTEAIFLKLLNGEL